jgi:hypothetical protein
MGDLREIQLKSDVKREVESVCSEHQRSSLMARCFWGNDRLDFVEEALRKLVWTGVRT